MTLDLTNPIYTDEDKARAYFEAAIWPSGPVCTHCGNAGADAIFAIPANVAHGVRAGLYECKACHGQFTVRTGTVMESSHLPLTKWAIAYRLMSSAKKGISAHQMHRTLGISYKTAWFLCHRIREAMRDTPTGKLGGKGKIVEADETFVGGKPRKGTDGQKTKADRKTPVAVLVERGGRVRAVPVEQPFDNILKRNIAANVEEGTEMHTDSHKGYRGVEKITKAPHLVVDHTAGEYAREHTIHVNTAESWNALLKRSIVGSFHHVSREHLHRYCDEVSFRWDRRKMDDTERTIQAVKGGEGKRLTYRRSSGAQPPFA
jgi:hypothetical protein